MQCSNDTQSINSMTTKENILILTSYTSCTNKLRKHITAVCLEKSQSMHSFVSTFVSYFTKCVLGNPGITSQMSSPVSPCSLQIIYVSDRVVAAQVLVHVCICKQVCLLVAASCLIRSVCQIHFCCHVPHKFRNNLTFSQQILFYSSCYVSQGFTALPKFNRVFLFLLVVFFRNLKYITAIHT